MNRVLRVVPGFLIGIVVGCDMPGLQRLHAPPQGHSSTPRQASQEPYHYMVQNAMLSEMSMSDIHFVPHTAQLNSLGARRLERYADLLGMYGGTLRYDSQTRDDEMAERRMENVREFLVATGLDSDEVEIVRDIPGGSGMNAAEAVLVLRKARTHTVYHNRLDSDVPPRSEPHVTGAAGAAQ